MAWAFEAWVLFFFASFLLFVFLISSFLPFEIGDQNTYASINTKYSNEIPTLDVYLNGDEVFENRVESTFLT
jgi:hypothetical protein